MDKHQYNRRERKKNKLNVRMSDSEIETLNRLSYEDDEPVSQIIRKAIRTYVNARDEHVLTGGEQ